MRPRIGDSGSQIYSSIYGMRPPRVTLRNLLIRGGFHLSRAIDVTDLLTLIRALRPVNIERELIRIGGPGEGGYLIPNDLDDIEACFSAGVGEVADFECGLAAYGIQSFMADYSVKSAPIDHAQFTFERKFIGTENQRNTVRLEDWINGHLANEQANLILQMDIEGAEYPVILDTPRHLLRRFRIIVVEFHALDMLFGKHSFHVVRQTFERLLADFSVVHIHPNNRADVLSTGSIDVPLTMEFTFYRRDRLVRSPKSLQFPHALDSPNHAEKPDIVLPKCWW